MPTLSLHSRLFRQNLLGLGHGVRFILRSQVILLYRVESYYRKSSYVFRLNLISSGKLSLFSLNLGEVPLLYILQASIQYFFLIAFNNWVIIFSS